MSPLTRYGATRSQIDALVKGLGEPHYRATQVWECLWDQRRPLEEASNLSKDLRTRLCDALPYSLNESVVRRSADDMTTKWLWSCAGDGAQIETVLMRYAARADGGQARATVCVSSQAGCAMACSFCATGQAGFERHLRADEILEQVVRAQHASPQRVRNVVFMGMGEPLANVDPVLESLDRLHRDLGLSARHITVSTVGVVPGMRRLAEHPLPVTLAVSLHAPDDPLRERLVPLTRQYPIAEVLDAARDYAASSGRRVTFEYACIEGENDRLSQADALADRLTGFVGGAHVNLIPLNPTVGYRGKTPAAERIGQFASRLRDRGATVTIRHNRGVDIDAACGQLRARCSVHDIRHNGHVNETRFLNSSQPQTLVIATLLLYLDAFFALLDGFPSWIIAVAMAVGGFGIANEKKWGYALGVAGAVLQVVSLIALYQSDVLSGRVFITFIFDIALVAALLHPMSRDYQKIWFK